MAGLPALPGEPPLGTGTGTASGFATALADLVDRRVARSSHVLRPALPDVDETAAAVTEALRSLPPAPDALVHGDLIAANVLVDAGRPTAVLDFGFLTAVGDPAFDVAVTASVYDMYGPHARETEERLDAVLARRFGHDPVRLDVYRAAYALATSTCFGRPGRTATSRGAWRCCADPGCARPWASEPAQGSMGAWSLRTRNQWWGVVLDAPDAQQLGRFYEQLLGWRIYTDTPSGSRSRRRRRPATTSRSCRRRATSGRCGPPRTASPRSRCTSTSRSTTSRRPWRTPSPWVRSCRTSSPRQDVRVMLDPAGHPFCLYVHDD